MFDGITIQTLEEHAIPDLPQFVKSTGEYHLHDFMNQYHFNV